MCYDQQRWLSKDELIPSRNTRSVAEREAAVDNLRGRLAETEARLARARAREAELSRELDEMKRFVSVMEILETYLKRRFREQEEYVARLLLPPAYVIEHGGDTTGGICTRQHCPRKPARKRGVYMVKH